MRGRILILCIVIIASTVVGVALSQAAGEKKKTEPPKACHIEATIDGAIGPASLDFLQRAKLRAERNQCGSLLLLINTPGGSLQSTRLIVEEILNSPIPVLCLIYPSGGHAGSAGAIIMQACHINGGVEATNIGAATPITSTGEKLSDDLRKKMINDTRAWVEGLAKLRGRSEKFARDIVDDAKAVSSKDAFDLKAIDFLGTKTDFLKFVEGKKIKLNPSTEIEVSIGEPVILHQDLRYRVMDLFMNPQVAYLIFMASLGLLYFEVTHPGFIAPGVIGGVGLIISLISLHMLNVTWGAVILILAGIALMVAEAFVSGFGILGIGGVVSFFLGSLFLFDLETTGYALPMSTILPTTLLLGAIMFGVAYLAYSTRRRLAVGDIGEFVGKEGEIVESRGDKMGGLISISGETWRFSSEQPVEVGDLVIVTEHKGLILKVKPKRSHI